MIAINRKSITEYLYTSLYGEVNGLCPLCGKKLLRKTDKTFRRQDEIAHIYPHSPSKEEIEILKNLPRLSDDSESQKNLIPLCHSCHDVYDNPKTSVGYMELYNIKKEILSQQEFRKYYSQINIEKDIVEVLKVLGELNEPTNTKLSYKALTTKEKFEEKLPYILQNRINKDIIDFYILINDTLKEMEKNRSGISDLIAHQVKTLYLKLKMDGATQEQIYNEVSNWIDIKTNKKYHLAVPIITAFYIQNCEVFK